jgi:hypothetical protein
MWQAQALVLSSLCMLLAHAGGDTGAPDLATLRRLIDHPLDEVNRMYRESLLRTAGDAKGVRPRFNGKDDFGAKKYFTRMLHGNWDKVRGMVQDFACMHALCAGTHTICIHM